MDRWPREWGRMGVVASAPAGQFKSSHILAAAVLLIFGFLLSPTVDFDEGYFFQSAVHATRTGFLGFPWTDAYFGGHHLYIPLNSLVPVLNWPLAYLPNPYWLLAGRSLSALAVCGGLLILLRERNVEGSTFVQHGSVLFGAFCLPLLFIARTIRPEALAFLGFCIALYFARRTRRRDWLLSGVAAGLVVLAHTVHGGLVCLIILAFLAFAPASSWKQCVQRVVVGGLGITLPLVAFYGTYLAVEGLSILWEEMKLLIILTPHISTLSPMVQWSNWTSNILGQINLVPLLAFAVLAVVVPISSDNSRYREIVLFKIFIVGFFLFWIFLYPKKSLSPVVLLLPLSWLIFAATSGERWRSLFAWGLAICIGTNVILLGRYHWRLLQDRSGLQQIAPIARVLEEHGLLRPNTTLLTKIWLVFALPPDITLWDITVFPRMMRERLGQYEGLKEALRRSDAVVMERADGRWIDQQQAELADHLKATTWQTFIVQTNRYFAPVEIVVFTRRNPPQALP
jgi:hypothetical protein